ncbi:hypothetical protein D1872_152800 [compost metagenome]
METLLGATLVWFLGNPDLVKLLVAFTMSLAVIYTVFALWQRMREEDKIKREYF